MKGWDTYSKICGNCFKQKPLSEFYRKLDRFQAECKICRTEICYIYKNKNNPDKVEAYLDKREKMAFV